MLRKLFPWVALSVALVAGMPGPVRAETGEVSCGSEVCFRFRVPAMGRDPEARSARAMDVVNKYLGGKVGKVTARPHGKEYLLLLNGEEVAVVTPADAHAEKQPSVRALATFWAHRLAKAFNDSKAQK